MMGVATVSETMKTWESGKLKLTLTRKQTNGRGDKSTDTLIVINRDGETQGEVVVWKGTPEQYKVYVNSMTALCLALNEELYGPEKTSSGCSCPVQHHEDCIG